MTDEEKQIIEDAIRLSFSYANGGVRTFVDPEGYISTNYVKFRRHQWNWTDEHCKYAIEIWKKENAIIPV